MGLQSRIAPRSAATLVSPHQTRLFSASSLPAPGKRFPVFRRSSRRVVCQSVLAQLDHLSKVPRPLSGPRPQRYWSDAECPASCVDFKSARCHIKSSNTYIDQICSPGHHTICSFAPAPPLSLYLSPSLPPSTSSLVHRCTCNGPSSLFSAFHTQPATDSFFRTQPAGLRRRKNMNLVCVYN